MTHGPDEPDEPDAPDAPDVPDAPDAPDAPDGEASGPAADAIVVADDGGEIVGARTARTYLQAQRRRRRRALLIVVFVLVIPLGLGAFAVNWWQDALAGGKPGAAVRIEIAKGASVRRIADELNDSGVITSSLAFQLYARLGNHRDFAAGRYVLERDMGVRAAVRTLEKGPVVSVRRLTIVPGLWLDQIAAQVQQQLGIRAATFIDAVKSGRVRSRFEPPGVKSVEGLLFPDTYDIAPGATADDVVKTLVARFDEIADEVGLREAAAAQRRTPYQLVTIASMIQREAKLQQDRPLIASVIDNRLAKPMRLQIDATSLYADRFNKPAYDTYKIDALPPGPIASTAKASLAAAAHPATTDYLYYVLIDKSGKHAFSSTYAQFLKDKQAAQNAGLLG